MLSKPSQHRISQKTVRVSAGNIFKKKIHFNEANIHATHNALLHDYGLIKASNTTFPRLSSYLHLRLHESQNNKDTNLLTDDSEDEVTLKSFSMSGSQTPDTYSNYGKKRYNEEFYRKRKLFNQGEFIVTKQKLMSKEIPGPGPSIGGNWRRLDSSVHDITRTSLKFFMGQGQLPQKHSRVNDETLRKITEQILFNISQPDQ